MASRLLQSYEREPRYVRELGVEFARRFPKVAGRLGISGHNCDDPHVERLFQGFALNTSLLPAWDAVVVTNPVILYVP